MDPEYDTMLRRSAATERVCALRETQFEGRASESVGLDAIGGRTLSEPVVASVDQPACDRATMDGFAFDATADYPFAIAQTVFPEDDPPGIEAGDAVEIATGAPLPDGANAVLRREDAVVDEGALTGPTIDPGTYVHRQGSTVAAGETLFEAGETLSPKDAVLLTDLGVETVPVYDRLRAGVLATGTEIHEGRQVDSDSAMLCGLVRSWGGTATYKGTVPDDYEVVEDRLATLATDYDVVVTTGGTSVGTKDYAVRALDALGEVAFHQVRVRPGKPIAAARLPAYDASAFAIPGKPLGAHTVGTLIMGPFFTGDRPLPTIEATLSHSLGIDTPGFEYAIPVVLSDGNSANDGSRPDATALGHPESTLAVYGETFDPSVLSANTRATRADGIAFTESTLDAGEEIPVIPYNALE
jgi:molybdopterin molybdotransferase